MHPFHNPNQFPPPKQICSVLCLFSRALTYSSDHSALNNELNCIYKIGREHSYKHIDIISICNKIIKKSTINSQKPQNNRNFMISVPYDSLINKHINFQVKKCNFKIRSNVVNVKKLLIKNTGKV